MQKFAKWRSHSASIRDAHSFPGDAAPWTSKTSSRNGLGSLPRQCDVLDIAFMMRPAALPAGSSRADIARGLWANPSQSVVRSPWTTNLGTGVTTSEFYSFEHDVMLSGHAHMRVMGFPSDTCPHGMFSETQLSRIGGNCYSVPIVALISSALYLNPHATWW